VGEQGHLLVVERLGDDPANLAAGAGDRDVHLHSIGVPPLL
jgi:hypothetical protein